MSPPLSIRLFALLALSPFVATAVVGTLWELPVLWVVLLVTVGLVAALWQGSRVAWAVFLLFQAVVVLSTPAGDLPPWWALLLNVVSVVLLAAPPTVRYVWRPRPPKPEPVSAIAD